MKPAEPEPNLIAKTRKGENAKVSEMEARSGSVNKHCNMSFRASDGDAVAVTLERNRPPVFRESCSRNWGVYLRSK